jgi:TldD protein
MSATRREFMSDAGLFGLAVLAGAGLPMRAFAGAPEPAIPSAPSEIEAMIDELERGITELRLPDADPPYAASLSASRIDSLVIDGSYGGVSIDLLSREASASVGVYVGSRERDNTNYYGGGNLEPAFQLPAECDIAATRKRLWLGMDLSYRAASAAYKAKLNAIDRLADKNLPADHGPWPASIVKLGWSKSPDQICDPDLTPPNFDRAGLRQLAADLSGRFKDHPKVDNGDVIIHLQRSHGLGIACDREGEGPVQVRRVLGGSQDRAILGVVADVQAEDGMQLDHGLVLQFTSLPSAAEIREQATALTDQVLRELEELLAAPMIDEDYDGPLLLSPLAAAQLLAATIPAHASGDPPPLSDYGRLLELEPHWQDELGKAVMPEFIDIVDDPLAAGAGHYELDAQGVPAQRIELVRQGILHTLLMANQPNAKIAQSNGHARASGSGVGPSISNLTLSSRKKGLSQAALEKDLLARAREDGYDFAYVIESLRDGRVLGAAPRDGASMYTSGRKVSLPLPGRVFKIDAKGQRTQVRGAMLAPMSMRVLRRIRAVGDKPQTQVMALAPGLFGGFTDIGLHGMLSQTVDTQITTPALLIDGLELVVERGEHERLPILDHPLRRPKE